MTRHNFRHLSYKIWSRMDFEDTPEEAAFRKEALAWLAEHAPPRSDGGSPISLFEHQDPAAELS
jgi:hypothetical protein